MAAAAGLAVSTVQRIWKAHGLAPHRWRTFKLSADPAFAEKLHAIVGLYVSPPAHAVVLAHLDGDTSLSIAELARRAGVARQTMHRAVTQLVDEGLLTSTPGPGFPRSTLIGLTKAGHRRRDVALGILHDLEDVLDGRLGTAALVELRESLARAWPK